MAAEIGDHPGGLHTILEMLNAGGVNVEYMYAFVTQSGRNAILIFRFDPTWTRPSKSCRKTTSASSGEELYSLLDTKAGISGPSLLRFSPDGTYPCADIALGHVPGQGQLLIHPQEHAHLAQLTGNVPSVGFAPFPWLRFDANARASSRIRLARAAVV